MATLESVPMFPTGIVEQESEEETLPNAYALLLDCLNRLQSACKGKPSSKECSELAFALEHATTNAITTLMAMAEVR